MLKIYVTLLVTSKEYVPNMAELIAQRAYCLDKVEDVEVITAFPAVPVGEKAYTNGHKETA